MQITNLSFIASRYNYYYLLYCETNYVRLNFFFLLLLPVLCFIINFGICELHIYNQWYNYVQMFKYFAYTLYKMPD